MPVWSYQGLYLGLGKRSNKKTGYKEAIQEWTKSQDLAEG